MIQLIRGEHFGESLSPDADDPRKASGKNKVAKKLSYTRQTAFELVQMPGHPNQVQSRISESRLPQACLTDQQQRPSRK
jgi:hypothetical protein